MKFFTAVVWLWCLCTCSFAQQLQGADYVLTIDGIDYDVALEQAKNVKLKSGLEVPILLKKREYGRFTAGGLSFEFPGTYSVASSPVDEETTQHIVVTGLGTMMLVQHYQNTVPTGLLDVMFDKMVEEPKALGLKIDRSNLSRTIANNQILEGTRAYYKGGDDDVTIDITITQTDQGGYMVMTMHDNYTSPDEKKIIERFWQSLVLKK